MRGQGKRSAGAPEGAEGLRSDTRQAAQPDERSEEASGRIDTGRFQASMERLFKIYSEISAHADEVMLYRCPYKDARARCTARFECRNQFFTSNPSEKPICAGSDRIDYRPAWVNEGSAPNS